MGARNRTQVLCGSDWHSEPISNLSIPGRFSFYVFVVGGGVSGAPADIRIQRARIAFLPPSCGSRGYSPGPQA